MSVNSFMRPNDDFGSVVKAHRYPIFIFDSNDLLLIIRPKWVINHCWRLKTNKAFDICISLIVRQTKNVKWLWQTVQNENALDGDVNERGIENFTKQINESIDNTLMWCMSIHFQIPMGKRKAGENFHLSLEIDSVSREIRQVFLGT